MDVSSNGISGRKPHVVIIGGGFGGLYAARALKGAPVDITLVDRRNYHLFQPLLYQVATAVLNPGDIASPIRRILRHQKNLKVLLAEATAIDLDAKKVVLSDGEVGYDFLIAAPGATHSYFGRDEWAETAPGLKTIEDALEIRRRALVAFEAAEKAADDPQLRREWLTFVIVGAGPTGVEMAGALADMGRSLRGDFRNIDPAEVRVILVEAEDRVLPTFPPKLSAKCVRSLTRHGVEVRTGTYLTDLDDQGARLGDEKVGSRNVLWAAGVAASPLGRTLGVPVDKAGRVMVEPDLSVPGHPEAYVIGDLASLKLGGRQVPGVAQAAIQGGNWAAENILRTLEGLRPLPFGYHEKGMLATVGRGAAVADFPKIQYAGFFAWVVWLVVHILFLIGFRNRLLVLTGWLWGYLARDPGARLITGHGVTKPSQTTGKTRGEDGKPPAGERPASGQKPPAGERPASGQKPPAGPKPPPGTKPPADTKPPAGQKQGEDEKPPAGQKRGEDGKPPAGQKRGEDGKERDDGDRLPTGQKQGEDGKPPAGQKKKGQQGSASAA